MPVTGHIIGDQPKRELGNISKTLIIRKEGWKKQTRLTGWIFDFTRKYDSYSTEEETMRYYRLLGNELKERHVIKTPVTG